MRHLCWTHISTVGSSWATWSRRSWGSLKHKRCSCFHHQLKLFTKIMSNTNQLSRLMMHISETHQRSNISCLSLLTWRAWQTLDDRGEQRISLASKRSQDSKWSNGLVKLLQIWTLPKLFEDDCHLTWSPMGPGAPGNPLVPSSPLAPNGPCWPLGPSSPSAPYSTENKRQTHLRHQ